MAEAPLVVMAAETGLQHSQTGCHYEQWGTHHALANNIWNNIKFRGICLLLVALDNPLRNSYLSRRRREYLTRSQLG